MTAVETPRREEIRDRVQAVLNKNQPRNYKIRVDADAILEDDGWYHVVVTSTDDVRDRDFYDALANAELELNEDSDCQFLLVPAIADD